jgi:hypothetical protein
MPIDIQSQLFRVVAKSQAPEHKQVGGSSLLEFTMVPYWTVKDKEATIWYKGQLWNKDADKFVGQIEHNDVLLISGSLNITPNTKSTDEVKLMPYFSIRINGYSLKKVDVQKFEQSGSTPTQATEDIIAAKIAASSEDEIPF